MVNDTITAMIVGDKVMVPMLEMAGSPSSLLYHLLSLFLKMNGAHKEFNIWQQMRLMAPDFIL